MSVEGRPAANRTWQSLVVLRRGGLGLGVDERSIDNPLPPPVPDCVAQKDLIRIGSGMR
ncbi:hypothetical protein STENM327S_07612 [Streptomyces tendae]